jgi:2-oxoglutarate dehydrogenase E2 component (dihydrolipoamide succinyltransferase)
MSVEIKLPSVGESITEGTLARWFKKDGDTVRRDEPLLEVETEKATTEIVAPAAGRLRITVQEGQTVSIGAVVGRIEEAAAAPKETASAPKQPAAATAKERVAAAAPAKSTETSPAPSPSERASAKEAILSPAARRLAEEQGIDVTRLTGTGRGGRVTKEDVLTHLEQRKAEPSAPPRESTPDNRDGSRSAAAATVPAVRTSPPPAPAGRETRERMSPIRQRIAERLVAAQNTAAILTTFNEVDMTAVLALRAEYKESFKQRYGVNLGFMSFFVKACVEALRAFPVVNARIDGSEVVYHHYYNIGIAVSTDKGLMVPALRDADRLTFGEIEAQLAAVAQRARDGKIQVSDLQGGTFTITNGGVFGSLVSTPILNPPQSAILGMHAIQKRPVVLDDQIVARPMMYLALSYDHRLIDGREAVQFLVRVKQCIERPERLLLEI